MCQANGRSANDTDKPNISPYAEKPVLRSEIRTTVQHKIFFHNWTTPGILIFQKRFIRLTVLVRCPNFHRQAEFFKNSVLRSHCAGQDFRLKKNNTEFFFIFIEVLDPFLTNKSNKI